MDEFEAIARLFRPLAADAPEALGLMDDVAILPAKPGFDLVVTTDTLVEGVHFLASDPPDLIARKLLRVNLSDLAAKGAEPYGYLLNLAWPSTWGEAARAAFAAGLAADQARYGLKLFGGDTVATPGPLTIGATLFGLTPTGETVRRAGAKVGDLVLVSGAIGDGHLGLLAAQGQLTGLDAPAQAYLAQRYQLPNPRLDLSQRLRQHASAAADVSDGLLADAGHIGEASGVGIEIALDRMPLSVPARTWLDRQSDRLAALLTLATGGDDYEIVCTATPEVAEHLTEQLGSTPIVAIGRCVAGQGVRAICDGESIALDRLGWRHG